MPFSLSCGIVLILTSKYIDGSATSVDVEEHLYGLANKMGITVVTSSQVRIYNYRQKLKFYHSKCRETRADH